MHREHSIEYFRRDEIVMWTNELDAHDRRFDPANHKKHQGISDVQDAQPLVIDRGHPFVKLSGQRTRRHAGPKR